MLQRTSGGQTVSVKKSDGLKKVEFLKENNVPSVRVTYEDNTTATYLNPKKVEFGK